MEQLQNLPGAKWISRHPRLAAWLVLAVGMVALLIIEARDVGLLLTQWVALIVATVLVAGLCIWIVSWEDNNEDETAIDVEGVTNPEPKQETP
jgi:protein-S-isoprenylcysteine O-methyltransferase Ste14